MWLLDFLISVYQSVLDWFSDKYWYMRNLVLALPGYVTSLINLIKYYYSLALQGIGSLIQGFYNTYIAPIIDRLRADIIVAFSQLAEIYQQVIAIISTIQAIVNATINNVLGWLQAKYDALIASIRASIDYVLQNFIPYALGILGTLFPFINWIIAAAKAINPANIAKMYDDFQAFKSQLTLFVANPLGFMLGLFWQVFLDFVKYALGYALGAIKYDLPPIPNWNNYRGK